ncbi:MAG: glycosyltransferase, partial [Actinobacteria bacterium]|nr:glycosyltransferase [Actinomycetota bacterium]
PKDKRKKILFLCDDIRMTSGISTMAREIVVGTARRYNWVNLGAAINHPDEGKRLDISQDTGRVAGIPDASVFMYPISGYGSPEMIRQLMAIEKPDAIMFFTDPRYWIWLFQIENEIRRTVPMIYLNIWDDMPAPLYNKPYYESCDTLMAISKQTHNINKLVLGDKAKGKILKYVPHGINEKIFYPITEFMKNENEALAKKKKQVFGDFEPEFVVFYNARNIRRKCTSDLIVAYSLFCDRIGKEKASKCALLLHTQKQDENGTDLEAVIDLVCDPEYQKVYFSDNRVPAEEVNLLYNMSDLVALMSSNEGWGLSLTEGMMCGKMIMATVTGGMQDQMRFVDENGKWIDFDENFCSNHYGTYKEHGKWAVPLFPTNQSIVGSIPTPYILDDRASFIDASEKLEQVYNMSSEERFERGLAGREWVLSKEAMMSAKHMCDNVIDCVDETFDKFKPRKKFELIKIEKLPKNKIVHKLVY